MHHRSRSLACVLLAATAAFLPGRALANDAAALLKGGRIIFQKTDAVVMEREDLTIGSERVDIAYVFRNISTQPVMLRVAFPVDVELYHEEVDPHDFVQDLDFKLVVNGKVRPTRTVVTRKGSRGRITFHWRQTFPPGEPVRVAHHYTPGGEHWFMAELDDDDASREVERDFCVDFETVRELSKREGTFHYVGYILRTGAYWAKPIGTFRMKVSPASPSTRIFTCYPGLKRVKDGSLRITRQDYVPRRDIAVLFVSMFDEPE